MSATDPRELITVDFIVPLGDGSTLLCSTSGRWYHEEIGRWEAEDILRPISKAYAHHLMGGIYSVDLADPTVPDFATASGSIGE